MNGKASPKEYFHKKKKRDDKTNIQGEAILRQRVTNECLGAGFV